MKKFSFLFILIGLIVLMTGCSENENTQVLATTKPVYQFTTSLCSGTPVQVDLLVSENVSCLHEYTLQVSQMRKLESAELIVINGAGFEDFLGDILHNRRNILDCSVNIELHCDDSHSHDGHEHQHDPHIWLRVDNARIMAQNIYIGLCQTYPEYAGTFSQNLQVLNEKFLALDEMIQSLSVLSCRDLITFHNGFTYLAEDCNLHIVRAIEEESGSEASAQELISIIAEISEHNIPAIFTEASSTSTAAEVIHAETGVAVFELDMGLSQRSYFEAMEHNIKTLKEALE